MELNEPTTHPCTVPPAGWYCTRPYGHPGPCAAHPVPTVPEVEDSEMERALRALLLYEKDVRRLNPAGEKYASKFMQQRLTVHRRELKALLNAAPDYGLPAIDNRTNDKRHEGDGPTPDWDRGRGGHPTSHDLRDYEVD